MGNSNNVINLNGTLSSRLESLEQASANTPLPELILSARRIAKRHLDTSISKMFHNADDCLFEYADKSGNNPQQSQYFDAMRELRLLKGQICKGFFENFERAFSAAYASPMQVASSMSVNSRHNFAHSNVLSLVEEDDLEESLAVTHMSQRIYSECREELSAMVVRLNEIVAMRKFTKEANPLCPDIICGSFRSATESIEASIEIKLIIFKLFDKFVVQHINTLYQEINNTFITAGVLPTIKYSTVNTNGGNAPAAAAYVSMMDETDVVTMPTANQLASNDSPSAYAGPQSYAAIQQAFQQYQVHGQQNGATYSQTNGAGIPAASNGPAYNSNQANRGYGASDTSGHYVTHDIINGLSRLQTNSEYTGATATLGTQANGQIIKTGVLGEIARFGGNPTAKNMDRNDADVIDIVSMMFDYILNDNRLSDRIKLSIGRLQIPVVKLAIIDKSFFSKKSHPARELLNELAFTNSTLESEQEGNQKILDKIDYVVNRVLNEFDRDSKIFADLLTEFRGFLSNEHKVDQLAKNMLLQARKTVVDTIQSKIEGFPDTLPHEVHQFLLGPWKEVMNMIGIRDDCKGEDWDSVCNLADCLLWSIQAKMDAEERNLLAQYIPSILLSIHEGIDLIDKFHQQTVTFIKQLESLHLIALRSNLGASPSTNDTEIDQSLLDCYGDETADNDELSLQMHAEAAKHDAFTFDISDPEIQNSGYFDLVRDMPLDTWLEFKENTDSLYSGKLTWKSSFTGDYVFMNRRYKPVADVSMRELINMFENGSVTVSNNVPLLDQAIDSAIKCLNNCVGGRKDDSPIVH